MLVGVICPDGKTKVSFLECLRCKNDRWCGTREFRFLYLFSRQKLLMDRFRVSSLCYLDPAREVFYRKFDYYIPINLVHIFTIGHAIHKEYQRAFPPEDCEVRLEVKFNSYSIKGSADIFHNNILYDIKTVSHDGTGTKWYYKNQLSIYATMLEDYYHNPVKQAFIWQINKSTGANKLYEVEIDKEVFERAKEVAETAHKCLQDNSSCELFMNVGDHCRDCFVKDYCNAYKRNKIKMLTT